MSDDRHRLLKEIQQDFPITSFDIKQSDAQGQNNRDGAERVRDAVSQRPPRQQAAHPTPPFPWHAVSAFAEKCTIPGIKYRTLSYEDALTTSKSKRVQTSLEDGLLSSSQGPSCALRQQAVAQAHYDARTAGRWREKGAGRARGKTDWKTCLEGNLDLFGLTSDRTTAARHARAWPHKVEVGAEAVMETWHRSG